MVGMIGGGGISMGGGAGLGGGGGTSGGGGSGPTTSPETRLQEVDTEIDRIQGILNSNEDYSNLADAIRRSEKWSGIYAHNMLKGNLDHVDYYASQQLWGPLWRSENNKLTALKAYQAGIMPDLQVQLRQLQKEKEDLEQKAPPFESPLIPDYTLHLLAASLFPKPGVGVATTPGASFGKALSNDYRATFFAAHPELEGEVIVHHAVEQGVLTKFPEVVTEAEMHSLENLRGIPTAINSDLHLSQIRVEWNRFYKPFIESGTSPTKAQLLEKATEIDAKFGSKFAPPCRR
jgi:hypothetical protein